MWPCPPTYPSSIAWHWISAHTELHLFLCVSNTFSESICVMLLFLALSSFSPDARIEPPRWACALCALGLFVYQTLDAIDGKQARRSNTSSPLGELFDHGCDSISTVFVALSACISVRLGFYPKWMFFQVSTNLRMFCMNVLAKFLGFSSIFVLVFLCNDPVLLCALANLCVGHIAIWQSGRHRGSMHNYGHSHGIGNIWPKHMDDKGMRLMHG